MNTFTGPPAGRRDRGAEAVGVPRAGRTRSDDRLVELARVIAELAAARDSDSVVDTVVTRAAAVVGSSVATVSLLVDDETFALAAIRGGRADTRARWSTYPVAAATPAGDALRSGMPLALAGRDAILARYPDLAGQVPDERSLLCLPLQVAERPLGVIGLVFPGVRTPDGQELEFLTVLADTCAQALDRVAAIAEAREASTRLSFLADASAELASDLDYRATLTNVARLAVPALADWCAVHIVEDGRLHALAVAHVDPAKISLARQLQERYPPDPDAPAGSPKVARTGVSELYAEITDDVLVASARDEEHLRIMRALQLRSALVVPLTHQGRVLGTITLIHAESGRRYGKQDLSMAEDLARRAAVAIDNAHLHTETRDAAALLQQAVLPEHTVELPGWKLAAHYSPAGRTQVGGDFYDTVALPGGRIGVVVGDVMGRGVAAAAAMAQIRAAVRAYVALDPDPREVLRRLDTMFAAYDIPQLVTLVYVVADPRDGGLTIGSAGHLPPLRARSDGTVDVIEVPPSLPLGVEPTERVAVGCVLEPGETVLLYTDGLVERRGEDIDVGLTRLAQEATALASGALSTALAALLLATRDEDRDDDATAVAVRRLRSAGGGSNPER